MHSFFILNGEIVLLLKMRQYSILSGHDGSRWLPRSIVERWSIILHEKCRGYSEGKGRILSPDFLPCGQFFSSRLIDMVAVVWFDSLSFQVEPDSCVHQSDYPKVVKPADECPELSLSSKELLGTVLIELSTLSMRWHSHDVCAYWDRIASGEVKGSEHTRAAIVKHSQIDRTQWLFDVSIATLIFYRCYNDSIF